MIVLAKTGAVVVHTFSFLSVAFSVIQSSISMVSMT